MSKNPNRKDDDDGEEHDDADDETLRRGCCVKRCTSHESSLGGEGAWNWTCRAGRRYLGPKREHPTMPMAAHDLIHLNRHLEVYIVRHTHRSFVRPSESPRSYKDWGGFMGHMLLQAKLYIHLFEELPFWPNPCSCAP